MTTDVGIIGAGAIGLSAAHYLTKAGLSVEVFDSHRVAAGVSERNSGQISEKEIAPLQGPGVVQTGLRSMLSPDSSLYVHPAGALASLNFMIRFALYCNKRSFERGKNIFVEYARGTQAAMEEMADAGDIDRPTAIDYLHVLSSTSKAAASRSTTLSRFDVETSDLIGREELHRLEPALGEAATDGFIVKGHTFVDPGAYCLRLGESVVRRGGRINAPFMIERITRQNGEYVIEGPHGTSRVRQLVLAAGVGTPALLKLITKRHRLPIYPGKGYSLRVRGGGQTKHLLKLEEAHVGVTPHGDSIHIAGTMEFDGHNPRYNQGRVDAIIRSARPFLNSGWDWNATSDHWVGSRPMTPDGLPIIGKVPGQEDLIIASGHNMLGMMLAPKTGQSVTNLVVNGVDRASEPFRLERY
ncbi:FAD-dependent oxidoreductase [Microbacterium jejuense]|uniref:FAD-dependent oxidoreductase n=1 Tax=Microbacterium jejuense TaxID=1263637 RepID=A0ABS7HJD5_9MICO|nr:FAD-dependent oxidoreductase [Microbacterium jejuense]MBW9093066.1 FAD-dependent oxidoreductase [Microbacterium jejuense]